MGLPAGKLREPIRIEVQDLNPTTTGEQGLEWSLVAEVEAEVKPIGGGTETILAMQQQGRVPTRFRIRYLPGVRQRMRVVWPLYRSGDPPRWFDIRDVQDKDGMQEEMILVTEELAEIPPR